MTSFPTPRAPAPSTAQAVHRLFVGLMPGAAVQAELDDYRRRWFWPEGRTFPAPERLHLTLHFLGDVPLYAEAVLRDALAEVEMPATTLVLRTPEVWTNDVAVLRPDEDAALALLHHGIGERLRHMGLPAGRQFQPHVTLVRKAREAAPPEAMRPILWPVRGFALVWSRLGGKPRYEIIGRYGAP